MIDSFYVLCSTDLFIDWRIFSTHLSDYISKFGETQLRVVSRTSLVNLGTGVAFKLLLYYSTSLSKLLALAVQHYMYIGEGLRM